MKAFYTFLLLSLTFYGTLNADVPTMKQIDNSKKVIQIGMFIEKLSVIDCIQKYKNKYNLFTKSYKNFKIVYAVNIKNENLSTVLKDIKLQYVDAFINNKVYFKNKTAKASKPTLVLSEEEKGRLDIIQIGMFEVEKNLFDAIRKYGRNNTMMIKPYKNTYIAYLMNYNPTKSIQKLDLVKKSYSDAFLNKKIHLYTKPQPVITKVVKEEPKVIIKEKVVIKYIEKPIIKEVVKEVIKKVEKPKLNKPVDVNKLITSFENLPFAIYGRI